MSGDDDERSDREERARAAALAGLVDDLVAGAAPPAALPADERALLETATMIHAAARPVPVGAERAARLLAEAESAAAGVAPTAVPPARRRRPWLRAAPWALAALAAAAAALLALRPPARAPAPLPAELRSRPADRLVGEIEQRSAGAATVRSDVIYADRVAGWRQLLLRKGARP